MPTDKRLRKKEGRQARLEAARAEAQRQQRNRRLITAVLAAAAVVAVLALVARGAGSDKKTNTAADKQTTTTAAAGGTTTTVSVPEGLTKPVIEPQQGPAPSTLVSRDITVGTGAVVKTGDTVTIHYVGVLYDGGTEFDSSWKTGKPATFDLDSLIPGWQQGIPGMKVGGRRELIVPPDLGYGSQASGSIPANSTLVFVIDLLGIGA